jgi:hypothetical protein
LRHVDVKLQLILVEGWQYLISFFFFSLVIHGNRDGKVLTNRVNLHFNPRRHDLIPLKDLDHPPATSIKAGYSTEGVYKGCIGGEEPL